MGLEKCPRPHEAVETGAQPFWGSIRTTKLAVLLLLGRVGKVFPRHRRGWPNTAASVLRGKYTQSRLVRGGGLPFLGS